MPALTILRRFATTRWSTFESCRCVVVVVRCVVSRYVVALANGGPCSSDTMAGPNTMPQRTDAESSILTAMLAVGRVWRREVVLVGGAAGFSAGSTAGRPQLRGLAETGEHARPTAQSVRGWALFRRRRVPTMSVRYRRRWPEDP